MPLLYNKSQLINYFVALSILLFNCIFCIAQDSSSIQYTPPLDIPLMMSGNFGDIRNGSFHFGIDFRTEEREGFPVFAVADGYVARIKIEAGGYGRAVYVNHPNGITSVYAHLKALNDTLTKFMKNKQYLRESFAIDFEFKPEQFPIKQCDTLGYSGNAGLSSGPHLHFELRDSKTQYPLNCMVPDFPIVDTLKPIITKLWIYSIPGYISGNSFYKINYEVKGRNGCYFLKNDEIVQLPKYAGFGLEAYDYITDTIRKLSFYSVKMYVDSLLWFNTTFDEMSFDQVGYVNSCIDYQQKNLENKNIYRQFLWSNQEMLAYKITDNKTYLNISDTLAHSIDFFVNDKTGNTSSLHLCVKVNNDSSLFDTYKIQKNTGDIFNWREKNSFSNEDIKLDFPENCFLADLCFEYSIDNSYSSKKIFSKIFKIGNPDIPLKKAFSISIPIKNIPKKLQNKLLIASISKNHILTSIGGIIENSFIKANTRYFGSYVLAIDTIAPSIIPVNISKGKNMSNENNIRIRIVDKLSGIAEYRGTIDGKWALFEFDAKNELLTYTFDSTRLIFNHNKHNLHLKITDKTGNSSSFNTSFIK
jgi:murein DD-endopeptidase MepM/ murein hydrolase activator NlpD